MHEHGWLSLLPTSFLLWWHAGVAGVGLHAVGSALYSYAWHRGREGERQAGQHLCFSQFAEDGLVPQLQSLLRSLHQL